MRVLPILAFLAILIFGGCSNENDSEGQILFWTQKNFAGGVQVFLDGEPYGNVNNPFPTFDPECGEQGTLTVFLDPGTYAFHAETNLAEWNDNITVVKGTCVNYLID